jgi:hypothetical protein
VYIEWQIRPTPAVPDDERSHGQVGDELAVHYIDVDPVCTRRLARLEHITQIQEIG